MDTFYGKYSIYHQYKHLSNQYHLKKIYYKWHWYFYESMEIMTTTSVSILPLRVVHWSAVLSSYHSFILSKSDCPNGTLPSGPHPALGLSIQRSTATWLTSSKNQRVACKGKLCCSFYKFSMWCIWYTPHYCAIFAVIFSESNELNTSSLLQPHKKEALLIWACSYRDALLFTCYDTKIQRVFICIWAI